MNSGRDASYRQRVVRGRAHEDRSRIEVLRGHAGRADRGSPRVPHRSWFRHPLHMYDEVLDQWDLPRPRELTRAAFGMSNESYFVKSAAGEHVLRVYSREVPGGGPLRARDPARADRRRASVPYPAAACRAPPATPSSSTPIPRATARSVPAHPWRGARRRRTPPLSSAPPQAFARLDMALARIERTDLPSPVFTGDLRAMHPAVTDLDQLDQLDRRARAGDGRACRRDAPRPIYASLPTQLIHGDFGFGNILARAGRVRGHRRLRVRRPERPRDGAGGRTRRARSRERQASRCGVRSCADTSERCQLDATEIAALPALAVLHWAVIVVWWAGRSLEGHPFPDGLAVLVDRALSVERWMSAHGRRARRGGAARERVTSPAPQGPSRRHRCGGASGARAPARRAGSGAGPGHPRVAARRRAARRMRGRAPPAHRASPRPSRVRVVEVRAAGRLRRPRAARTSATASSSARSRTRCSTISRRSSPGPTAGVCASCSRRWVLRCG